MKNNSNMPIREPGVRFSMSPSLETTLINEIYDLIQEKKFCFPRKTFYTTPLEGAWYWRIGSGNKNLIPSLSLSYIWINFMTVGMQSKMIPEEIKSLLQVFAIW